MNILSIFLYTHRKLYLWKTECAQNILARDRPAHLFAKFLLFLFSDLAIEAKILFKFVCLG